MRRSPARRSSATRPLCCDSARAAPIVYARRPSWSVVNVAAAIRPNTARATRRSARCTSAASPRTSTPSMSRMRDAARTRPRAAPAAELRQSHHRPATRLDLGVLARPAAPAVAAALHRVRRLVTPALHLAPIEDDLDVLLRREHLLERVVQLPPALRDDEEESVHDVAPDYSCRGSLRAATQSTGGRCWAHGRARSKAAEARNTSTSSKRRPTIWSPMGNRSLVNPHGTDAAGWPVTLNG